MNYLDTVSWEVLWNVSTDVHSIPGRDSNALGKSMDPIILIPAMGNSRANWAL